MAVLTAIVSAVVLAAAATAAATSAASPDAVDPTVLDLLVAWTVRTAIALLAGLLGALGLVAAIRKIPWLQEVVLPHADELDGLGERIEEKVRNGKNLTEGEARVAAGLAVRCGLTLLAALVFAGAVLQRL